ncbi:MAG: hypothetical protein GQ565_00510 [Candidatus Aegiribacteria sp.]|nr:hypothetical protein [Candidatus Aegiribacteria sp.]
MLDKLKQELVDTVHAVISSSVQKMPGAFRNALHSCVGHNYNLELSLLACASSRWCGSTECSGMPAAIAALMLRAGITVHLEVSSFAGVFERLPQLLDEKDDTLAILAGDGLIALAIEYLADNGGMRSSRLVSEAVKAVGAGGMLTGLSMEVDRADGVETVVPDGRSLSELYSGQLARFASHGGALLAGASDMMLDDAAQIGVLTGRARFLVKKAESSKERDEIRDLDFQARTLIEQAETIAGHKPNAALFNSIMYLSDFI